MSEAWHRIEEVFVAALEHESFERDKFLDEACGDDKPLRAEVDSLLASHEQAGGFIEAPAVAFVHELLPDELTGSDEEAAVAPSLSGQRVGNYAIERELGRGGMGTVYLAHRADDQYKKLVAIKIVRRGMDTNDIVRRFRNERQILASLEHPNIARLLDGGTTGDGVPYIVMEYVEGVTITNYCDEQRLKTNERLQMFRIVCAAVQHAHQNLVVHRDLKPSNILITADGTPKLLDFGIAKLLSPELSDDTSEHTLTELRILTPDYASPEQVRGETLTTTSDIYSLGVVLYELLTGHRPYHLVNHAPHELARVIGEQQPAKPSTAAASVEILTRGDDTKPQTAITPEAVSRARDTQPDKLHRLLSGDLDNVILMAMRKEPARRYSSVGQFSEDIRRHLDGLPVIARKDTFQYRSQKFIQRNKLGVAAATLVVLTLIGGIVATAWQAKRVAEQRDRARVEATKTARINTFLQSILAFSDPTWLSSNTNKNRETTISDVLDEAGRRAQSELADQPEVEAAVRFTIGDTYRAQSRFKDAEPHLRAALDIRRRVLGSGHQDTAQSMVGLAEWHHLQGQYAEAESLYREALAIYRREQTKGAVDAKWFAIDLNNLGLLQQTRGNPAAAEPLLREAMEISAKTFTGSDRATFGIMNANLANARRDQGDLDGAIAYYQKALEEFRHLPGKPRFELVPSLGYLAAIMTLKGEYAHAESLAHEALNDALSTVGEQHQYTAYPLIFLADNDYRRGDYRKAKEEIDHALEIQERVLSEGNIDFARSWVVLGKILTATGESAQGESYLRRATETRSRIFYAGHPLTAEAQGALGENLTAQKRYTEAEPFLTESYTTLDSRLGQRDPRTVEAKQRLVKLYEAWDKPEQAAQYRALL